MNWNAAAFTGLVHFAALLLVAVPLGHRTHNPAQGRKAVTYAMPGTPPALALVAEAGTPGEVTILYWHTLNGLCPDSLPVDTDAEPDFPLFGEERPFQRRTTARWSPVFCARIDRNGRIAELRLTRLGTGSASADRHIARELAGLRFQPARRDGQPVAAWHRILVNLPGAPITPLTDRPTPSSELDGGLIGPQPSHYIL